MRSLKGFFAFVFVFLMLVIPFSMKSYALDPSEEQRSCFGDPNSISSSNRSCELVLCEWENIVNNWPEETGYEKDCETGKIQYKNTQSSLSGVILLLSSFLGILFGFLVIL